MRATYEVYAGGVTILQLEAEFDVTPAGYRLMTVARTRGLAATFVPGEQAARVVGEWAGMAARPVAYGTDGVWRGRVRRTVGREVILPWREAWHGPALRCAFEGRLVAGFRLSQQRADTTPQRGTAWVASPFAGAPPIPVRVEVPSRWFGQAVAVMLRAELSAPGVAGQQVR